MMDSSSLWFTKFRLGKMKPSRYRQSRHQGQSTGQARQGPAGFFQRIPPKRGSWIPSKSKRHKQRQMLWRWKRKVHPVLLGWQDVGWQNQIWNFPTQNESGNKTGDRSLILFPCSVSLHGTYHHLTYYLICQSHPAECKLHKDRQIGVCLALNIH